MFDYYMKSTHTYFQGSDWPCLAFSVLFSVSQLNPMLAISNVPRFPISLPPHARDRSLIISMTGATTRV